ncbi:hypothetical protein BK005_02025 [bacterium CG10_37_50]|nr:MAG: hypothetical protein BK005_02025 [bacterium CG10_37_50]
MKILVITKTLATHSGMGRYSAGVIQALRGRDLEVSVISEDKTNSNDFLFSKLSIFNLIRNIYRVRRTSRDCQIVHAFDGWPYSLYAYFAVWGTKKSFLINIVGTYSIAVLYHWPKRYLMSKVYQRADNLLCISNFIRQKLTEVLPNINSATVYLGLPDLPKLNPKELEIFQQHYGLINRGPIILTVGEIKNRKGQFPTLQAVAELKKTYSNILYCVVGDVGSLGYLNQMKNFIIENNLVDNLKIFTEINSDHDLRGFYQSATVFALNAVNNDEDHHYEGFGLTLLEAASFGVPVVASENSGTSEALDPGINGYLTKQNNPSDITSKIKLILESNPFIIGQKGVEFSSQFTWEKTAGQYYQYYLEIIK